MTETAAALQSSASAPALCASCPVYEAAKPAPPGRQDTPYLDPRGTCRRYPPPVPKAPDNWCGEHPQRRMA
jgi:hypothetical protein